MFLHIVSSLLYEHQAELVMVLGFPKDSGLSNSLNVINYKIIKLLLNSIFQERENG
jgi:hypothetical protein